MPNLVIYHLDRLILGEAVLELDSLSPPSTDPMHAFITLVPTFGEEDVQQSKLNSQMR